LKPRRLPTEHHAVKKKQAAKTMEKPSDGINVKQKHGRNFGRR
jgi:hypothetical protein